MDKGIENSTELVTISKAGLEELKNMKKRLDRLEWRIDHPIDAMLGRQQKEGKR